MTIGNKSGVHLFSITIIGLILLIPIPGYSGSVERWISAVGVSPQESALYIRRVEDGAEWMANSSRVEEAYPPASTAKVPHTLIALETGIADGPETRFPWDGEERWLEVWNQNQTLASAYKYSALWVYQGIVSEIGHGLMEDWMGKLDYGNEEIGGEEVLTTYWLNGPLKVSAKQQVDFLLRLALEDLPLSGKTFDLSRSIFLEGEGNGWRLYSKTGWSSSAGIGWYVGWLEVSASVQQGTYGFAFNMDIGGMEDLPKRKAAVRRVLAELGVLRSEV